MSFAARCMADRCMADRKNHLSLAYAVFFGTGVLLNLVASINRAPHDHHSGWAWLQIAALVLMFVGIGFQLRVLFGQRRGQRPL